MKNKIYPFLLGLSCIVIVALVSFKNSEKVVEKEQMIIYVRSIGSYAKGYEVFVSTANNYESFRFDEKETLQYSALLNKIQEYQKEGWGVTNSISSVGSNYNLYYTLERDKK